MAVLRTRVTGPVMLPDGSPAPNGGKVIFRLRSWDRQGGALIMKGPEEAVVVGGVIDKTLNRTSASERGTLYDVIYTYPNAAARGQWLEEPLGSISLTGAGPVALADLLAIPAPVPNVPDALAQALGAAASAQAAAASTQPVLEDRRAAEAARDEARAAAGAAAADANAQIAPAVSSANGAATRAEAAADAALGAAGWDQSVPDEAARLALTGLPANWRVYQIAPAPGRIWRWTGTAWADTGENPLGGKANQTSVDTINATLTDQLGSQEGHGPTSPIKTGTGMAGGRMRIMREPFQSAGPVATIIAAFEGAGAVRLKHMRPDGANWRVIAEHAFVSVAGINTITDSGFVVQAGDALGWYHGSSAMVSSAEGGIGYWDRNGELAVDASGAFTGVGGVTPQVYVELEPVYDLRQQFDALAANVAAVEAVAGYGAEVILGGNQVSDTGTYASTGTVVTRLLAWDLPFAGIWTRLKVAVGAARSIMVHTMVRKPDGKLSPAASAVVAVPAGVSEVAIPNLAFPADGALAYESMGVAYSTGYQSSRSFTGSVVPGVDYTFTAAAARFECLATVRPVADAFSENRLMIDKRLTEIGEFNPDAGSWSIASDAATPSGTGEERLILDQYTVADRVATTVRVKPGAAGDVIGILRKPAELQFGCAAVINGTTGKISISRWDGAALSYSPTTEADLAVPLVAGREYTLELSKARNIITFTIRDCITQAVQTITATTASNQSRAWGKPGLLSVDSAPSFLRLSHRSLITKRPRLLMGADSITEGENLGADVIYREANLLEEAIGQPVHVSARGGSNELDMLGRWRTDVQAYRPEFVRLLIGTNDRGVNNVLAWSQKVHQMIAYVRAIGAVPIIGTLPPNSDGMAFINAANAYILAGSFGPDVRIIDYAAALSIGHDRVTLNTALFLPDGTHPNVTGHSAMKEQALVDVPELAG